MGAMLARGSVLSTSPKEAAKASDAVTKVTQAMGLRGKKRKHAPPEEKRPRDACSNVGGGV